MRRIISAAVLLAMVTGLIVLLVRAQHAYYRHFTDHSGIQGAFPAEKAESGSAGLLSDAQFEALRKSADELPFTASAILWQDGGAACDAASATVYIPVSQEALESWQGDTGWWRYVLSELVPAEPDDSVFILKEKRMEDPVNAVREGSSFQALLVSGRKASSFQIVLTGLPAVCLYKTDEEEIAGREPHDGRIRLIDVCDTEGHLTASAGRTTVINSIKTGSGVQTPESAGSKSGNGVQTSESAGSKSGNGVQTPESAGSRTVTGPAEMNVHSRNADPVNQEYDCTFHLRGNSSATFAKKPYKISLLDEKGDREKAGWLGMRADDDWILNPLYSDCSRVREMTAYELWEELSAFADTPMRSSRMQYVELFFNDSYEGIYGLQEPVDGRQLGLSRGDLLYKINVWNWDYPYGNLYEEKEAEGAMEILNKKERPCVKIEYPADWDTTATWLPMQAFHRFTFITYDLDTLAQAGLETDTDSIVSMSLFSALIHGMDNAWKNTFLVADKTDDGKYTLHRTIWDLNFAFGDVSISSREDNDTAFDLETAEVYKPCQDTTYDFQAYAAADPGAKEQLREKWAQWRRGGLSADRICGIADTCMEILKSTGAAGREEKRWPQKKRMDVSMAEMQTWIRARVPFLDTHFGYE